MVCLAPVGVKYITAQSAYRTDVFIALLYNSWIQQWVKIK
jgi:hypothetical protein